MRRLHIYRDNRAFLIEMQRSGNGKVPPIMPNEGASLPVNASVLVGDRSPSFGGGLAATGYVMVSGKAIGSVSVSPSEVARGYLEFK
jgi:hypothetical protein